MIQIEAPIWKDRSVGIDESKLESLTAIEIMYKTKNGKRLYPDTYYITREKAMKYPAQKIKNVKLRLIPIADLDVKPKPTNNQTTLF